MIPIYFKVIITLFFANSFFISLCISSSKSSFPKNLVGIRCGGDISCSPLFFLNTNSSASSSTTTNRRLTGGSSSLLNSKGISSNSRYDILSKRGGIETNPGRVRRRLMDEAVTSLPATNSLSNDIEKKIIVDMNNEEGIRKIEKVGGPLKVLFLSSDTGGGHRASAEALARHFQMYFPGTTYDLYDCWTLDGCLPYRTLVNTYKHLSKNPRQWKFLYHFTNMFFYLAFTNLHSTLTCERKIRDRIKSYNPDVIVSVHPTMNNVPFIATKKLRKELKKSIPFFTVVTDFGSGHAHWFRRGVDKLFVASDRIRKLAKRRGRIPDKDLVQSGLPIRHDFAVQAQELGHFRRSISALAHQKRIRIQLGVEDPHRKLVLVMGGGEGVGSLSSIIDALYTTFVKQGIDATIILICGRNEELKQQIQNCNWNQVLQKNTRLKKRRHLHKLRWAVPSKRIRESLKRAAKAAKQDTINPGHQKGEVNVMALGFVKDMAKYMVASDVLVTKAGPGTIAEAAALGLPVMLTSFLPGQEAGNVNVVLDGGFGDFCDEPWGIAEEVACWFRDDGLLDIMSLKAAKIGVPDAASDIVIEIGQITHDLMEK